jgi:spore photoproduct lyase
VIAYRPAHVFVTEESWADPATTEMIGRLPGVPVVTVPTADGVLARMKHSSDPLARGKRAMVLARHRGLFMNPCPGDGAEMCCNYRVVNFATNCPMDCTYCVLQSFLENPAVVVFTNIDDLTSEVAATLSSSPQRAFRIGAGDLSDSLALDHITHYSRRLIPLFARSKNGTLELKTKSDNIANLAGLDHGGRTVVSWSVNSKRVIESEELKTATLGQRIAAAQQCQEWGYRLGFHFDPLIHSAGWEADYEEAVKEIFLAVDPVAVAWVSLGGLRFTARLRDAVRRRFPKSRITYGEFVPGNHGKWRYFRPIREEMYARLVSCIRRYAPDVFIYLCMEGRAAWQRGMDFVPQDARSLSDLMDALV